MRPLMYGYARVLDGTPDETVQRWEQQLRRLAEVEGFCLATTFYENQPGGQGALAELVEELRRAEAHHVVVPSVDHISPHPLLRTRLLDRLEREASAQVWVADRVPVRQPGGSQ